MLRHVLTAALAAGCVGLLASRGTSAEPERSRAETIDLAITLAKQARKTEDRVKYERVLALLAPLDTPDNTDATVPFWEGVALRHLKRPDEAIAKYALADKLSPYDTWILNDWGIALSDSHQEERAIEKFRAAFQVSPENVWPYNNLGRSLDNLGRYAEAEPYLRTAVALDPAWAGSHENLGLSLAGQGKYGEALVLLHSAVQLEPRSASAQHALGWCLARMKRWEEALQTGRQAIDLDETDPLHQDFVGWVLSEMGRFAEALPYAERAVMTAPTVLDNRRDLAYIQYKLGRYDDLAANGREMIRLEPQNAAGYDYLGGAQISKWQFGAAQESFRHACELSPNDSGFREDFQEARRKFWALRAGIAIVIALVALRIRRSRQHRTPKPSLGETPAAPASP